MSEGSAERDADLFSPTLTESARRELPAGSRPWRLGSQFYVAFFGGPLAAGAIAVLNGRRLGLSRERLWAIAGIGLAGFVVLLAVVTVVLDPEADGGPRLILAVAGVASFVAVRELQKGADRLYGLQREEAQAYDSMLPSGVAVVLACGVASVLVLLAVT